jgi:dynein heavy chain
LDKFDNTRWILCDGPVDALWIENLNTVLDDNKKLCLSSGEIVKFTPKMTMLFEVDDLTEASPATVSRCGMVYMEPDRLGSQIQLNPWYGALPASLVSGIQGNLYMTFIKYIVPKVEEHLFSIEYSIFSLPNIS